jgi:hypothetical protein
LISLVVSGRERERERDRRDRWYKFDPEEPSSEGRDAAGSNVGHNDDDNFEAAAAARAEAKRKGVARVEAFLDMMSYKSGDGSNDTASDDRCVGQNDLKTLILMPDSLHNRFEIQRPVFRTRVRYHGGGG